MAQFSAQSPAQSPPHDILNEIFNHFINDIKDLHSFLFVNKIWSSNVVTILWNRPFHLLLHNNINLSHQIISTYLSCLDKEERSKLVNNDLSLSFSSHPPSYNYSSFLRHLSYFSFVASIQEWCIVHNNCNVCSLLKIIQALFRLFSKSSPSLETLIFGMDLNIPNVSQDFNITIHSPFTTIRILHESIVLNWISHIKEIELAGDFVIDKSFPVLLNICKDLKKIEIRLPEFDYDEYCNRYDHSVEMTSRFIELQRDLKHFVLQESHYPKAFGDALMHQRSSLRHVEFIDTIFDRRCQLDWLPYCKQLETLTFIDSEMLTEKILTPLRLSPLKKLRSLTFKEDPVPTDILEILIKSSNNNLREILFGWPEDCNQAGHSNILNSISLFCPNLTKLGATIGRNEIPEMFLILEKCRHLQYLEIYGNECLLDVNEILPKLGKSLPPTLSELDIGARWSFSSDVLHLFLVNVSLYRFGMRFCDFINDDHLMILKNSNSLKYITFMDTKFQITDEEMKKASEFLRKFLVYY